MTDFDDDGFFEVFWALDFMGSFPFDLWDVSFRLELCPRLDPKLLLAPGRLGSCARWLPPWGRLAGLGPYA